MFKVGDKVKYDSKFLKSCKYLLNDKEFHKLLNEIFIIEEANGKEITISRKNGEKVWFPNFNGELIKI